MKLIIFGATKSALNIVHEIEKSSEVIAFCDNDEKKVGGGNRWETCYITA